MSSPRGKHFPDDFSTTFKVQLHDEGMRRIGGENESVSTADEAVPEYGPRPLNSHVRNQMRAMPRSGSKIEIEVRRELHRRGLRFRVNLRGLPGTPDIALTRVKVAVFIDGCFWHGCPIHGTVPKNNRDWWLNKLSRNHQRDLEKDRELRDMGWWVLHYWEHDDVDDIVDEIEWLWREVGESGR